METSLTTGTFYEELNRSAYAEIDELPLMASPGSILLIVLVYLAFVLKIGPTYMKNRSPLNLKNTLLIYNFIQVMLSAYLVYDNFTKILVFGIVPRKCHMNDQIARKEVVFGIWLYFAAKVSELLDTVFFVLRKKDSQVTFLHLYHHSIMVIGTWAYFKYSPSHTTIYIGFLNSLVHVFMYTYYGLSALGPGVAKYLTWKKYLTSLQLVQFVSVIAQYAITIKVSECPPSKGFAIIIISNTVFFLVLFTKFYRQSYTKKDYPKPNGFNEVTKSLTVSKETEGKIE